MAGKNSNSLFLAADIGGTKTLIGLYEKAPDNITLFPIKEAKLLSKDWDDLSLVLRSFLAEAGVKPKDIAAGCLSLAGPITQNSCFLTNLRRTIDFQVLHNNLNLQTPLRFVNDLKAMGYGITILPKEDLYCLTPDRLIAKDLWQEEKDSNPEGNRALLAPGTGLGQALLLGKDKVHPTEAGHRDFAPRNEQEIGLWRFLTQEFGHVSYERVLSGPGLVNIYRFLASTNTQPATAPVPTPPEIINKALAGICPLCTETLELFIRILGAEAGNLALTALATKGVYLGGGIPPQILPLLQGPNFFEAFSAKGRFKDYLSRIPIFVILNEKTALLGAAGLAVTGIQLVHNN